MVIPAAPIMPRALPGTGTVTYNLLPSSKVHSVGVVLMKSASPVSRKRWNLGMDGSFSKVLALEALRPEFSPQHPIKLPDVVACARNPSAREAETGGSLTSLPSLIGDFQAK